MRYIKLVVTAEDQQKIEKRKAGEEVYRGGIFGQGEMLRHLLSISPKCTAMQDVLQLNRISRKLEELEGQENPTLKIEEDEWSWVKKVLDHDKYHSFGPQFMKIFGELLEAITEAKTEPSEAA